MILDKKILVKPKKNNKENLLKLKNKKKLIEFNTALTIMIFLLNYLFLFIYFFILLFS